MRRFGVVAALLCLLLLAGCTKPTPAVTIQSGSTTLRSHAVTFQRDGKDVGTRQGPKALTVRPGDVINVSVDRATARAGWVVVLAGQKISPVMANDKHHYSFPAPGFSGGSEAPLAVFQQPPNGGPAAGAWIFTLREEF
jgi:hypothetical protein